VPDTHPTLSLSGGLILRNLRDIRKRSRYIRVHTPNILPECFELQNHICDLCGQEIQCLEVAELDHSVSVYYFASSSLDILEAAKQCNGLNNLRAAHARCNSKKRILCRDEWFAKGMDILVGSAPVLTEDEIKTLKDRSIEIGRIGGTAANKNPRNRNRLKRYRTFESCSAGGKVGGAKNVETGQILKLGEIQGERNKKSGHWDKVRLLGSPITSDKAREQGLKNVESGHLASLDQGHKNAAKPGYMSKIGKIGGKKSGPIVSHVRWHVKRNIINPNCSLCTTSS